MTPRQVRTRETEPTDDPNLDYQRRALARFMRLIDGKSRIPYTRPMNERTPRHA